VFRIDFGPPKGVTFTFGPYVSGIDRTEFDQVTNPTYDANEPGSSQFIVGRTEGSSYSYGVAAYWNASLDQRDSFGISWGVAYTLSNELDTAVNGLVGLYYRPTKNGPGLIHAGLAVGRERELAGGWQVGDPIGSTEAIPTKVRTALSWFVGYGFRFGGS
jgi:hypothetical protein